MRRFLVASATAAVLLVASVATTASAATVPVRTYDSPYASGQPCQTNRYVQSHPFYRAWGNHYGFGPGHHQY